MAINIQEIKLKIAYLKYLPLLVKYKLSSNKALIDKDIERWAKQIELMREGEVALVWLLKKRPQFRNLFFYRLQTNSTFLKALCRPEWGISIAEDCEGIEGGALYYEHATCTRIGVNHMGYGCTLRQLTTLGVKSANRHNERPWIGNNVDFGTNVTCIGNIRIGDNAIIAAGSVVVKDVPDNAIVAGNPAKIIRYRDDI